MIRPMLAALVAVGVVIGGLICGAINTITDEDWPDYE